MTKEDSSLIKVNNKKTLNMFTTNMRGDDIAYRLLTPPLQSPELGFLKGGNDLDLNQQKLGGVVASSTPSTPSSLSDCSAAGKICDNFNFGNKIIHDSTEIPKISAFTRLPPTSSTSLPPYVERKSNAKIKKNKRYNSRFPLPEKPRQKRAVIQDMVRPLKQWLIRHRHNPYPTKAEKVQLALGSKMSLVQVSNWFANARRRLKNVVQNQRSSWSQRLRMYNQFVQGNAELLSISSDDSIWNSDDDDDDNENDRSPNQDNKAGYRPPPPPPVVCEDRLTTTSHRDSTGESIDLTKTSTGCGDGDFDSISLLTNKNKYKSSILHRYLADSVDALTKNKIPCEDQSSEQISRKHPLPIRPIPKKSSVSTNVNNDTSRKRKKSSTSNTDTFKKSKFPSTPSIGSSNISSFPTSVPPPPPPPPPLAPPSHQINSFPIPPPTIPSIPPNTITQSTHPYLPPFPLPSPHCWPTSPTGANQLFRFMHTNSLYPSSQSPGSQGLWSSSSFPPFSPHHFPTLPTPPSLSSQLLLLRHPPPAPPLPSSSTEESRTTINTHDTTTTPGDTSTSSIWKAGGEDNSATYALNRIAQLKKVP